MRINVEAADIRPTLLSLHIKLCRYCRHSADWSETKTKSDYTLWNLYQGSLKLEINGKTLDAVAGDVLLFKPGETYRAYCTGDCCDFLVTFFSIDMGNSINLFDSRNLTGIYTDTRLKLLSDAFCREFLSSCQSPLSPSLKQYADFLHFFADLSEYFGTQRAFQQTASKTPMLKIHRLLHYMDTHFSENISIRELAEYMDMNEKYFIHFFHIHIGKSPKQYLIDCRMKYALELLARPENSLSEIAARLHFSDQYAFTKAFKKYYGEAPGTFRKNYIFSVGQPSADAVKTEYTD